MTKLTKELDKCAFCGEELEVGQTMIKRYYHPYCDPKIGVLNPASQPPEEKLDDWEVKIKDIVTLFLTGKSGPIEVEKTDQEWDRINQLIDNLRSLILSQRTSLLEEIKGKVEGMKKNDKEFGIGTDDATLHFKGGLKGFNQALNDLLKELK